MQGDKERRRLGELNGEKTGVTKEKKEKKRGDGNREGQSRNIYTLRDEDHHRTTRMSNRPSNEEKGAVHGDRGWDKKQTRERTPYCMLT